MIVYTLPSFKLKNQLISNDYILFLLNKINADILQLEQVITVSNEKIVIGLGNSKVSGIESITINQFHRRTLKGNHCYDLITDPSFAEYFFISQKSTTSFCNLTAYKLAKFIDDNNLNTKLIFLHVSFQDAVRMQQFLSHCQRYS